MKIIQKNELSNFFELEDKILIVDNSHFKYLLAKKSNELLAVERFFSEGGRIKNNDLFNCFDLSQLNSKKLNGVIQQLLGMGILREGDFDFEIEHDTDILSSMLELQIDPRFGTELLWFESQSISPVETLKKLQSVNILIVGAGGLGSSIAVKLTAMGVRNLTVIDGDIVELDNLTRQIYYTPKQAEEKCLKVVALERFVKSFYPESSFRGMPVFIKTRGQLQEMNLKKYDLIIQTADFPRGIIDDWFNSISVEQKIPIIFAHHKTIGPFYIPGKSNCLDCLNNKIDRDTKGIFLKYKKMAENKPNSKSPSFVTGILRYELVILDMIVQYFVFGKSENYKNKIYQLNDEDLGYKIFSFLPTPDCAC